MEIDKIYVRAGNIILLQCRQNMRRLIFRDSLLYSQSSLSKIFEMFF